ncbi:hypothetical protein C1645_812802 [Glomus cerebriforme]|uniref:Uncharacterized protein n=1 Tax=Glomus cerebriforme TaxID=658196 RepID=A0A397TPI8_9GLOM|nr:hypothetical protein C1645_812802 [Glomus cerebriforme]
MTTVPLSPRLTPDCLEDIFEYLRDDRSSLLSCLLVNRLWCRLVIHLIWRDPFFAMDSNENSLSSIIQTYISCLPDTSKQIISKISNTDENVFIQQKPLFIYLKYLQVLDFENLSNALRIWHKKYDKSYDVSIPIFTIPKLIIDFIFKECSILTKLNIYIWDKWSIPLTEMNFDSLFNRKNGENVLINLKYFKLTFLAKAKSEGLQDSHQIIINLFKDMAKCSKNIQFFEVFFRRHHPPKEVDQAVGNLIKSQKNLRACKIIEYWDPKNPNIYKVLLSNNSLSYLNLSLSYFHQFFVEGLLACKSLETLELLRCPEMPSHLLDFPLKESLSIKYLKVVMNYPASNESLIVLLRMCNINLRKLYINGVDANIIDAICLNNTRLTHLSLLAQQQIFDPPQSLSALKVLTHLKLANIQPYIFAEHTLSYFIDSLPSSLQYLYFNFNIDTPSLKIFLNDCKIPLKVLEFHQSYNQDDEVFNALINYKLNQKTCEEITLCIEYPHTFSLNALEEAKKHIKIILTAPRNYELW